MSHIKYKMSEIEYQKYLESLSPRDLKKFQLEDKQIEISRWEKRMIFSMVNICLFLLFCIFAVNHLLVLCGIVMGIIVIGFIVSAIRSYNYMKSEILQHKMLEIFFNENEL